MIVEKRDGLEGKERLNRAKRGWAERGTETGDRDPFLVISGLPNHFIKQNRFSAFPMPNGSLSPVQLDQTNSAPLSPAKLLIAFRSISVSIYKP